MKIFLKAVVVTFLITSCGSYKTKQQISSITFPELGSIVKNNGALWYKSSKEVGVPVYKKEIKIKTQIIPFTKSSYKKYKDVISILEKEPSVNFVDSIPVKPKYMRLELSNKVELATILNSESNVEVANYLKTDDNYEIVTSIDCTAELNLQSKIKNAEMVLLEQDAYKHLSLILIIANNRREKISFSDIAIFNFNSSSFCWGENRFHKKEIKTLLSVNENCPAATNKSAAKINREKSYLKF